MSSTEEEEDKSVINENGETPSIIETTNKTDNSKTDNALAATDLEDSITAPTLATEGSNVVRLCFKALKEFLFRAFSIFIPRVPIDADFHPA